MSKLKPNEDDFQVDRFRLDDEWVRQPDLYRRYAVELADAKREHEEARNSLAVVRAETELRIRKNPEEFDLDKVTEGVIKAVIETVEEVIDGESMVVGARHKVNLLEAAVGALDHRKRALSDLVSLHLADYFSKPVARADGKVAMEEVGKRKARKSQRRRDDDDD